MSTFYANPGATGFLREWQWAASYTRWIPGVYDASFFYGRRVSLPWSRYSRLALGVSYLGIQDFDSTNGREPAANGGDLLITASLGQPVSFISKRLSLGGNIKFFRSRLDDFDASAFIVDFGLLFRSPRFGFLKTGLGIFDEGIFSAGIAATQLGSALKFRTTDTPLPKTLRAGIAFQHWQASRLATASHCRLSQHTR